MNDNVYTVNVPLFAAVNEQHEKAMTEREFGRWCNAVLLPQVLNNDGETILAVKARRFYEHEYGLGAKWEYRNTLVMRFELVHVDRHAPMAFDPGPTVVYRTDTIRATWGQEWYRLRRRLRRPLARLERMMFGREF